MINRCHRSLRCLWHSRWLALAIALLFQAPRMARADDQPASPGPPPGYPPPYQLPPPGYGAQPGNSPGNSPEEITDVDDNTPVPYGYTKVTRAYKGLIIGGAVTFGVAFGISSFAAAIGEDLRSSGDTNTDVSALWIPIIGPFLQATRSESATAKFYVLHLGVAQAAGAIMLFYGLTNRKTIFLRTDRLSVAPMLGNGASGMMVTGRF
jgi:hypothetical protein